MEACGWAIATGRAWRRSTSREIASPYRRSITNPGCASDQAIFVRVDRRGWVWFGTDHGVDVLRGGKWRHYGQQDGMIWDDCDSDAIYEDTDGSMWIGTSRGLAHFLVPAAEPVADGPRVEFSRFQLGDRVVDTSKSDRRAVSKLHPYRAALGADIPGRERRPVPVPGGRP